MHPQNLTLFDTLLLMPVSSPAYLPDGCLTLATWPFLLMLAFSNFFRPCMPVGNRQCSAQQHSGQSVR